MVEQRGIIRLFASHPVAGNLMMLLAVIFGLFGYSQLTRQVLPDFKLDVITISVAWPGASPEDIESNVLEAIEPEVRFVDGVDKVESTAFEGRAEVVMTFDEGTNLSRALTDIQSAVARITTFPSDIERPVISQLAEADEVCQVSISGPFPEEALKFYARQVRDDLLDRGLTRINMFGMRDSEIWVEVPDSVLRELDMSLNDISARIADASLDLPSGSIDTGGRSRQLRSEGLARSSTELEDIEIMSRPTGEKIRLRDVARVYDSFEEGQIGQLRDGETAIKLVITRSKGIDSMDAQAAVESYLEETDGKYPPSLNIEVYDVFAAQVKQRISMLLSNGFTGLILVFAALFLFLNWRIAIWVALGIPISIFATLGGMAIAGTTINLISLFAMIMGLGIIVDDAIVVGERAEWLHRRGYSAADAATKGALDMLPPVMAASLTTIAAFFPLLLITSVIGQIVGDLPVTIIMIIIASLIECFLILPAHLTGALKRMEKSGKTEPGRFHVAFNNFRDTHFRRAVEACYDRRYTTLLTTVCAFVLAIALWIGRMGFEFFPSPETNVLLGNFQLSPGTPRETTLAMMREMERAAYAAEDELTGGQGGLIKYSIASISTTEGRNGAAKQTGDHLGGYFIELADSDRRNIRNPVILEAWERQIQPVAGVEQITLFERSAAGPPGRDVDVRLYGEDLQQLKQAATELRERLRDVPGVLTPTDDLPYGKQEIVLEVTPTGKALGFSTQMVARQVRDSYEGAIAKRFARNQEEVLVRVKLPEAENARGNLRDLYLRSPDGREVPITEVVTLTPQVGFAQIRREDGLRQVAVTADVDDSVVTSGDVLALIDSTMGPDLRRKYSIEYGFKGRAEEQAQATGDVGKAAIVALLTMYIILAWVFSSYTTPFIVLSIVPFGLVGAVLGHWVMGFNIGIFSIFAIVGLAGIMINDSIILVSACKNLMAEGVPVREAILQGTQQRLRPVTLTTLTTVFGLLPLMFESSLQAQLVQPLAITLIFGIMVSPLLVLFYVPSLLGIGQDLRGKGSSAPAAQPAGSEAGAEA